MIDVVVPSLRKDSVERLLHSLSLGTVRPGTVSIVTNEIDDNIETFGLNVRLIRFTSDYYAVGYKDVALRCNVGVFASEADMVFIAGDDQIANEFTIEAGGLLLTKEPFWFGNHRLADFNDTSPVEQIVRLPPGEGISREQGSNRLHLWQSCYSGSFGIKRSIFEDIGGFDMVFNCRHGSEDQNIGKRLLWKHYRTENVFIHEPPFWWHPVHQDPWVSPQYTNLCDDHALELTTLWEWCTKCLYRKYIGPTSNLFTNELIWKYNNDRVEVRVDRPATSLIRRT